MQPSHLVLNATGPAAQCNGYEAGQYNRNPATGYSELNHICVAGIPPSAIRNVEEEAVDEQAVIQALSENRPAFLRQALAFSGKRSFGLAICLRSDITQGTGAEKGDSG